MEINFPKVNNKLAFFDFDRTLVAHTYSKEYIKASQESYMMECVYMLSGLKEEHAKDVPLPCMQWYTKKLFDDGYGLYCLTHEIFNLRDVLKQKQLKLFYSEAPMTYLTVMSPEYKIDMIKAIAMVECCDLSDIIFVDDRMDTINLALKAGINAKHLSDIAVMYETNLAAQQQDVELKQKNYMDYVMEDPSLLDKVTYEECTARSTGLPNEDWEKIFRECRQMAERSKKKEELVG